MKKILFILSLLLFTSCEKVIDLKLDTMEPKLVVDAALKWQIGTTGNQQTINLSTTTGYYQAQIPKVSGAIITVTNNTNTVFNFTENPNTVNYVCNNFVPVIGETYTLNISYNGQTYTAIEKLIASPSIKNVEQRNDLGLNSGEIGIKVNFNDFASQKNFYLFSYTTNFNAFPEFEVFNDSFFDGKVSFGLYSNKDFTIGKEVNITVNGISERYFNYMRILTGLSSGGGGPFGATPPSTLRGNLTNINNKDNYALGFFSLSQTDNLVYTAK